MRISDWSSDVCSSDLPLPRSAQLVFVSDFLMPLEDIERALRYYGQGGQRGALLQVLDPAEESLPYDGRVRFDGLRSEERRVGKEGVSTCRSRWSPYH